MKLTFEKRVLELNFGGETHRVPFPNVGQVNEFVKESKGKEEESLSLMIRFLDKLGLKEEVTNELEPSQMAEVVEVLCGSKKK